MDIKGDIQYMNENINGAKNNVNVGNDERFAFLMLIDL